MAEEPALEVQRLLRSLKIRLIDILSADPDFVLQHADSRCLVSCHGYEQVKALTMSTEKVRDLLDHVIQRGPEATQGFLELLKEKELQATFPMLAFLLDLPVHTQQAAERTILKIDTECSETRKRKEAPDSEEKYIPAKQMCNNGSGLVTEKQLMQVARGIGRSWREIGRLALAIPSVKLEQIEEDHHSHVERVFAMLRCWRIRQKTDATARLLHSLLSQGDWAPAPESIDFLLETS